LAKVLEDLHQSSRKKKDAERKRSLDDDDFPNMNAEHDRSFGVNDSLLVPNMHWRIKHRFKELERSEKPAENPAPGNFWLGEAFQMIEFKLEKTGAKVSSEARKTDKDKGGHPLPFHFNRPFLIYMKKRDAQHPFLVMWVDNAELLIKN
jgi:hypothetical protein